MKTAIALLLSGAAVLSSPLSFASYRHHHCHCDTYVRSWLVSQALDYTSSECGASEPLTLTRTTHYYSALGSLTVDAWQGAFLRPAKRTSLIQYDTFNCHGDLVQSFQGTEVSQEEIRFTVDNPNLHDDVTKSFVANAPLTDNEAKQALEETRQECLNAKSWKTP